MYTRSWDERDNTLYKKDQTQEKHKIYVIKKIHGGMEIADVDMDDREKMGDPSRVGKAPYCPLKRWAGQWQCVHTL